MAASIRGFQEFQLYSCLFRYENIILETVNPIVTYPDNTLLLAQCHFCVDLDVERNVHSYPCQFVLLGVVG